MSSRKPFVRRRFLRLQVPIAFAGITLAVVLALARGDWADDGTKDGKTRRPAGKTNRAANRTVPVMPGRAPSFSAFAPRPRAAGAGSCGHGGRSRSPESPGAF